MWRDRETKHHKAKNENVKKYDRIKKTKRAKDEEWNKTANVRLNKCYWQIKKACSVHGIHHSALPCVHVFLISFSLSILNFIRFYLYLFFFTCSFCDDKMCHNMFHQVWSSVLQWDSSFFLSPLNFSPFFFSSFVRRLLQTHSLSKISITCDSLPPIYYCETKTSEVNINIKNVGTAQWHTHEGRHGESKISWSLSISKIRHSYSQRIKSHRQMGGNKVTDIVQDI